MADGMNIVGRVSVKVTPDTRGFGRETARKLREIRDKGAREFKVQVVADTSKVEAQIDRFIAEQNARLLAEDKRIKFRTTLDTSSPGMRADVKRAREAYQAMADSSSAVKYDTRLDVADGDVFSDALKPEFDLSNLENDLQDVVKRVASKQVVVDRKAAMRTANLGGQGFWDAVEDRIRAGKLLLPIDFNEDTLRGGIDKLEKRLAKISNLDIKFNDKGTALQSQIDKTTRAIARQQDLVKRLREDWEDYLRDHEEDSVETLFREQKMVAAEERINQLQRERMGMAEQLGKLYSKIGKAQTDTDFIAHQIDAAKKKLADFDPKVKLELDKAALAKLERDVAAAYKKLDNNKVKLFDRTDDFRAAAEAYKAQRANVESIRKSFNDMKESGETNSRQYSRIANELRDAEHSMAELASHAERLYKNRAPFAQRVRLDRTSALKLEAEWRALKESVEKQQAKIKVEPDKSSLTKAEVALDLLARTRTATVWVRTHGGKGLEKMMGGLAANATKATSVLGNFMTRTMGLRLLYQTALDIFDIVPRLDMKIPQLAKGLSIATVAVSGLTYALGGLVVVLTDAARSFQTLLMAPALLAGLGAMGFVVVQAFKNFGKELPEVTAQYKKLKATVSDNFWKSAKGDMESFFSTAMPLFDKWAPSVSQGVGKMVGALARGLEDGFGKQGDRFFTNLNKSMSSAEGGFKALGSALIGLIGAGSDSFDGLGKWFTKTMESFDSWVKRSDENGNFTRWINEGAVALQHLGSVTLSTLSIFRSLADIFRKAGFPGLAELDSGLKGVSKTLNDPAFQKKALYPLQQMTVMIGRLKTLAPEFGKAMDNSMRMVGDTIKTLGGPVTGMLKGILDGFSSPTFQKGFNKFIKGIGDFITDVTPGVEHLTSEFGSLLGIVGIAASSWGPAMNSLLETIANMGSAIHPGLEKFIESTGPNLKKVIDDLSPKLTELAEKFGDLLANPDFQDFVNDLITSLGDLAGVIADAVGHIIDFVSWLAKLYGQLSPENQKRITDAAAAIGILAAAIGSIPGGGLVLTIGGIVIKGLTQGLAQHAGRVVGSWVTSTLAPAIGRAVRTAWDKIPWKGVLGTLSAVALGIGIGLAIADLIPADWFYDNIAAPVAKAFIPGDAYDYLVDEVGKRWDEVFDGKSLLDVAVEVFQDPWGILGDFGSIDLKGVKGINLKEILLAMLEPFGADSDGNWLNFVGSMFNRIKFELGAALGRAWDGLVGWVEQWEPARKVIDWGKKVWDWIKEFLFGPSKGNEGGGGSSARYYLHGTNILGVTPEDLRGALNTAWNTLWNSVTSWKPVATAISLGSKVVGWVLSLLGGGGFNPGAIITRITGFGGQITGALGLGVDILKNLILNWVGPGPIDLAKKIVDWIFGLVGIDNGSSIVSETATRISNAGNGLLQGIAQGVEEIKGRVMQYVPGGGAGGLIKGILGLGDSDITSINGSMSAVGGAFGIFGSGIAGTAGTMSTRSSMSFGTMRDNLVNRFGEMRDQGSGAMGTLLGNALTNFGGIASSASTNASSTNNSWVSKLNATNAQGSAAGSLLSGALRGSFSAISSNASTNASSTNTSWVSKLNATKTQGSSAGGLLAGALRGHFGGITTNARSQGESTRSQYVQKMRDLAAQAAAQAAQASRNVITNLRVNASGPGSYVMGTYRSGLSAGAGSAYSTARSIANGVRGALSVNAFSSGASIGSSFASGIASRIGAARSAAQRLAAAARGFLPNSPAKEGPFSGSGWGGWGESIADELAAGIRRGAPAVAAEAAAMMSDVSGRLTANPELDPSFGRAARSLNATRYTESASPAGGVNLNVNVTSTADDPLVEGARLGRDLTFALKGAGF